MSLFRAPSRAVLPPEDPETWGPIEVSDVRWALPGDRLLDGFVFGDPIPDKLDFGRVIKSLTPSSRGHILVEFEDDDVPFEASVVFLYFEGDPHDEARLFPCFLRRAEKNNQNLW